MRQDTRNQLRKRYATQARINPRALREHALSKHVSARSEEVVFFAFGFGERLEHKAPEPFDTAASWRCRHQGYCLTCGLESTLDVYSGRLRSP